MATVGELTRHADFHGYKMEAFEKAVRLLGIVHAVSADPYLRDQFALKGGSALNLFLLDAPRLSVDLDLSFVGEPERERMLANRNSVEAALASLVSTLGYEIRYQAGAFGESSVNRYRGALSTTVVWRCCASSRSLTDGPQPSQPQTSRWPARSRTSSYERRTADSPTST